MAERTGGAVKFPGKALSYKKARRWIEKNNPYPTGSRENLHFEIDFWGDQIEKIRRSADRVWRVGMVFVLGCLLGIIVVGVLGAVGVIR